MLLVTLLSVVMCYSADVLVLLSVCYSADVLVLCCVGDLAKCGYVL